MLPGERERGNILSHIHFNLGLPHIYGYMYIYVCSLNDFYVTCGCMYMYIVCVHTAQYMHMVVPISCAKYVQSRLY